MSFLVQVYRCYSTFIISFSSIFSKGSVLVALVTIQLIRVRSCVRPLVRLRAEWFRLRFSCVRPSVFFLDSGFGFVSGRSSIAFRAQWLRVRFRTSVFVRLRATGVSGTVSVRHFSSSCSFALLLPDFRPSCSSSSPPYCCRDSHGRLDSRRSQRFRNPSHDPQKEKHALLLFSRRRMCICFIPGPQIEYYRRAFCSQKLKPLIRGGQDLRRRPGVARKRKKNSGSYF